jgi:hypothetical protein
MIKAERWKKDRDRGGNGDLRGIGDFPFLCACEGRLAASGRESGRADARLAALSSPGWIWEKQEDSFPATGLWG